MAAWLPLRAVSGLGLVHCSLYLAALGEGGGVPYQLTDETEAPAAWGWTWGPLKGTKGQECPPPASFPVPREHSHSGDVTGSRVHLERFCSRGVGCYFGTTVYCLFSLRCLSPPRSLQPRPAPGGESKEGKQCPRRSRMTTCSHAPSLLLSAVPVSYQDLVET